MKRSISTGSKANSTGDTPGEGRDTVCLETAADVFLGIARSFCWASAFAFLVIGIASVLPMGASETIGWALFQSPDWSGFLRYGFVGLWDFPNLVYLVMGAIAYFTHDAWRGFVRCVLGAEGLLTVASASLSVLACAHALVNIPLFHVVTGLAFQALLVYALPVLLLGCDMRSLCRSLAVVLGMLSLVCIASLTFDEALLILVAANLLIALADGALRLRHGYGCVRDGAVFGKKPQPMPATSDRKARIVFQFACACLLLACAAVGYAIAVSDVTQNAIPSEVFSNGGYYLLPRFVLMSIAVLAPVWSCGQRTEVRGWRFALPVCLTVVPFAVSFSQAEKIAACGSLWVLGSVELVMMAVAYRCHQLFGAEESARLVLILPVLFGIGAVAVSGAPMWRLVHPGLSFAMLLIHAVLGGLVLRSLRVFLFNLLEGERLLESRLQAFGLTFRERDVVRLLMNGRDQGDVADEMGVAPSTVSTYIRRSCTKMGVEGAGELRDRMQEAANSVQIQRVRPSLLHIPSTNIDQIVPGLTDCLITKCGCILLCSCFCAGAALQGIAGDVQSLSEVESMAVIEYSWLDVLRVGQIALGFIFAVIAVIDAALFFKVSHKLAAEMVVAMGLSCLFGHSAWKVMAQVNYLMGSSPISSVYPAVVLTSVAGALGTACLVKRAYRLMQLDEDDVSRIIRSDTSCTPAEVEVAICMLKGDSILETAEKLFISRQTVVTHRKRLYAKLEVHSRDEMVYKIRKRILDWSKGAEEAGQVGSKPYCA